jgi:ATP-dependent DNA helicase RecG
MADKLPINLLDLLRQRTVEGERIEYKAGWNPDAILRTLCAFANDFENLDGGYVVIGQDCDASGQPVFPPVGLADNLLDKIQQELLSCCQLIQPPYFPTLSVEVIEGRKLIVLWAPGGQNRPYKAPGSATAKNKTWHYYIRRYSSTVEAKGEIEQELLSLAAKVPFDDRFALSARVDDLSRPLMQAFLLEVGSALVEDAATLPLEKLGRQMNVVGGPAESPWPKNVGLLFFNESPERFFAGTQIDVLWFPDGAGGNRFVEKTFRGPISRMTREALDYIQRNYLYESVIKHPQRAEAQRFWNFPFAAVEEAVVNAVYHRSYEEREPIEVRISRDELVVVSFPGPDRSIRLEDLQAGRVVSRRYRNRRIGEFLKELDLTEGRATGIPKIFRVMAANGSPLPLFETDDERTSFVVRLPRQPLAQDPVADGIEVTTEVTMEVTTEVAALLKVIHGDMSRQAMQTAMGLKNAEHFRKAYVLPAIASGCLEMTLPEHPNSRLQRYRLTDNGRKWLSAQGKGVR